MHDIFNNFSPTSSHLQPLQVENCGSNSRLVVDEDDNGKFRLERVNTNVEISAEFEHCVSSYIYHIFNPPYNAKIYLKKR